MEQRNEGKDKHDLSTMFETSANLLGNIDDLLLSRPGMDFGQNHGERNMYAPQSKLAAPVNVTNTSTSDITDGRFNVPSKMYNGKSPFAVARNRVISEESRSQSHHDFASASDAFLFETTIEDGNSHEKSGILDLNYTPFKRGAIQKARVNSTTEKQSDRNETIGKNVSNFPPSNERIVKVKQPLNEQIGFKNFGKRSDPKVRFYRSEDMPSPRQLQPALTKPSSPPLTSPAPAPALTPAPVTVPVTTPSLTQDSVQELANVLKETLKEEMDEKLADLRNDILNIHSEMVVMASQHSTELQKYVVERDESLARLKEENKKLRSENERLKRKYGMR